MDSGHTGFQVAPTPMPTEAEMTTIKSIFQRSLDSIVGVATLSREVAELKAEYASRVANLEAQLAEMKRQLDALSETNRYLSEQLTLARQERDHNKSELVATQDALKQAQDRIASLVADNASKDETISHMTNELAHVRQESEARLVRAVNAEAKVEELSERLEEAIDWVKDIDRIVHPPKAEPEPVETEPEVEPVEAPQFGVSGGVGGPSTGPTEPAHSPAEVYQYTPPAPAPERTSEAPSEPERKTGTDGGFDPYKW